MVTLAFVLAFTLPVGYQKYSAEVTAVWVRVSSGVQVRCHTTQPHQLLALALCPDRVLTLIEAWFACPEAV